MRIQGGLVRWGALGLLAVGSHGWGERFQPAKDALGNLVETGDKHAPTEPGKCGVYRKGAAEVTVCIESVVEYHGDVQQVNAFVVNSGDVPVCELQLKPLTSGTVYSFWPDWASSSSYEVFFSPKQVTGAGLTGTPSKGPASVELVSFRDCAAPRTDATGAPSRYHTVPITTVQPKQGAEPSLMAGQDEPAVLVPEGKCAVYTMEDGAELAHCVESVVRWGADVVQVNAFLTNVGKVQICDLQVAVDKSWKYYSVWPEWAEQSSWVNNFEVGQTTAIGATAPARGDQSFPTIHVTDFRACANQSPTHAAVKVRVVELKSVMGLKNGNKDQQKGRGLQYWERPEDVEILADHHGGQIVRYLKGRDERLAPGKCGIYTKPGNAQAALCLKGVQTYDDETVVELLLVNTGDVPLCELRVALDQDFTYMQVEPSWALDGEWADNFLNGTATDIRVVTEAKPNGMHPFIALDSFEICGVEPPAKPFRPAYERVPMGDLHKLNNKHQDEPKSEVVKDKQAGSRHLQEAAPKGAVPAGKCGVYRNGSTELTLCVDSLVTWGSDVQQLNGFLLNTGHTPVCNLRLKPVTSSRVLSFWPDWAEGATWQVYFNPNQVTAVGLTAPPGTHPYIDVEHFEPCDEQGGQVSYHMANIADYQPLIEHNSLPATPSFMAASDTHIAEGKCGVYRVGSGSMALCIESIIQWGNDVVQVNGFLENTGKEKVCNVKVGTSGAERYYSIWPEWVAADSWANDFQPGQVTAVGLTAPFNGNQARPEIFLQSFQVCGQPASTSTERIVPDQVVDLASLKKPVTPVSVSNTFASLWNKRLENGRHLAADNLGLVEPGKCSTFENGAAKLKLCVDSVQQWGGDVIQVSGALENVGQAAICDLRLSNAYATQGQSTYSSWPEWVAADRWEQHFVPGQSIKTGFTAPPRDGVSPALTVVSFRDCSQAATSEKEFSAVAEHPLAAAQAPREEGIMGKFLEDLRKRNGGRGLAEVAAGKVEPSKCSTFENGAAKLKLCVDPVQQWGGDVIQVAGSLVNVGQAAICDLRLSNSYAIEGQSTYSSWPEWVAAERWEQHFVPGQTINTGFTAAPMNGVAPGLLVVSFRDCSQAPTSEKDFHAVAETPAASSAVPATPDVPAATQKTEGRMGKLFDNLPRFNGGRDLAEAGVGKVEAGKCGTFENGAAKLKLCVDPVQQWGADLLQVSGELTNIGGVSICDLRLTNAFAAEGQSVYSSWPEWVAADRWEQQFVAGQSIKTGFTAPPRNGGVPYLSVVSFRDCSQAATSEKEFSAVAEHPAAAALPGNPPAEGILSKIFDNLPRFNGGGRNLAASQPGKVEAGKCGTFENGAARLKLCVDPMQQWGADLMEVSGTLENIGGVSICDLRLTNSYVIEGQSTYSSWPEWVAADRWEQHFAPGQSIKTGFTAPPRGSANYLSIVSFRDCSQSPESEKNFHAEGGFGGLGGGLGGGKLLGNLMGENHRGLATKKAPPTTKETINWDQCGYFKGTDGQSEVALCWKDANTWNDKRKGRIVQANLILVNTGKFGVCNVSVHIENLDQETGDHYPNWYDDDGVDHFPDYPGYFAPDQIVNLGAAVPVARDYPEVYVEPTFSYCNPEPPKAPKPRNVTCQPYDQDGVQLKLCTYTDLKEWTDYHGPRYVMVEGYFENTGSTLACNVTIDIENFGQATASWGEWMPVFPYKMTPGQSVKYGANIPFKKGFPKTGIKNFINCGAPGTRMLAEGEEEHGQQRAHEHGGNSQGNGQANGQKVHEHEAGQRPKLQEGKPKLRANK